MKNISPEIIEEADTREVQVWLLLEADRRV
jgi:hypothetical protein